MKIFISMGFSGRSHDEIEKRRELNKKRAKEIVNSFTERVKGAYNSLNIPIDNTCEFLELPTNINPPITSVDGVSAYYLGKSIELIAIADMIIFDYDWQKFRGCRIEKAICDSYHLTYTILNRPEGVKVDSSRVIEKLKKEIDDSPETSLMDYCSGLYKAISIIKEEI